MTQEEKALLIMERLYKVYPKPRTALEFKSPLQLLIATMLAAQTTDKLVNTITPVLFEKYPTAADIAKADEEELDAIIVKTNFHRNKAKNIIASSQIIAEQYKGEAPQTMEELDALPGVARKTANVVLGNAYGKQEGITVDTHVIRMANKLGLTTQKDPVKIEQDLMKIVPQDKWTDFANLLTLHGREKCTARPHTCEDCPLGDLCPDMQKK